jgi:hypothetical protein
VRFHELRDLAASGSQDSVDSLNADAWELDWAPYLNAYLKEGLFPRDHVLFGQTLKVLHGIINTDAGFESRLGDYRAAIGKEKALELRRAAVAYALTRADMPPQFRDKASRDALVDSVGDPNASNGGGLIRRVVRAVVRIAGRSTMVAGTAYATAQVIAKRSVWKIFRLPGDE